VPISRKVEKTGVFRGFCTDLRKKVRVLGKKWGVFGRFENGQRERAVKVAIFYNPYLVCDT
jgi:hypothetical protein